MKTMKITMIAIACALALGLTATKARADLDLNPSLTPNCGTAPCLVMSGPQTGTPEILLAAGLTTYTELYKQDVGISGDEGSFAASYVTEFSPTTDPLGGTVTWVGGSSYITADPIYLLVKDGNQVPAWYLFDISTWTGQETIHLDNFWPDQGAISHVAIYGTGTSVPDGGATLMLLGGVLVGLETLRRRLST
jgi:hypothetical protein